MRLTNHLPQYSTSAMGAMSELRIAIDLTLRGYEVFRALEPSATCDLIALKDGKCLRVQVKTATTYTYAAGGVKLVCSRGASGQYDLLAMVHRETQAISYESPFGEEVSLEPQPETEPCSL